MTEHPITPPPELVASLRNSAPHGIRDAGVTREIWLIHNAFAAGADQELEACVEHLKRIWSPSDTIDSLYTARRPKPPSLAEPALEALDRMDQLPTAEDQSVVRRALEHLQELEKGNE